MKFTNPLINDFFSSPWPALALIVLFFSVSSCRTIEPELYSMPAGTELYQADQAQLESEGEALWSDPSLSASGRISCASCHDENFGSFKNSFAEPYPHYIGMVDRKVEAAEIVQFCLLKPMKREEPLDWNSPELAALNAYTLKLQREYQNR